MGSQTIIIQILLILGIISIVAWLFIKRGAKQLAVRRLLIIFFAIFGVFAVALPQQVTAIANLVGVGRGADLLLYSTVIVLLGFLVLQEVRTKNADKKTTYLARKIAIYESQNATAYRSTALNHSEIQHGENYRSETSTLPEQK